MFLVYIFIRTELFKGKHKTEHLFSKARNLSATGAPPVKRTAQNEKQRKERVQSTGFGGEKDSKKAKM